MSANTATAGQVEADGIIAGTSSAKAGDNQDKAIAVQSIFTGFDLNML
ncbi:hypothetical protein FHR22_002075 [Sphingopyxis panaciterrae]|nr:hypothetical protein [Sphingopyxis panaciterrae]NIJ37391.1 hypothetical protein [Sphingopyxis panaciterrae]